MSAAGLAGAAGRGPAAKALRRLGFLLVVVILGTGTGWAWRAERRGTALGLGARDMISALVRIDGKVSVTEDLTLAADPPGDRLVRRLPFPPGDVTVAEVTDDGRAVAASVAPREHEVEIAVPLMRGTRPRLVLRYALASAVASHRDGAELWIDWMSTANPVAFDDLTVVVGWTPEAGPPRETQARGRPAATVEVAAGRARFGFGPLDAHQPAGTMVALRPEAVPGLAPDQGPALAVGAFPPAAPSPVRDVLPIAVAVAFVAAWLALQQARGREPHVEGPGRETGFPSEHPPAEVGWLLRFGQVALDDLVASIYNLARRGALDIECREGGRTVVRRVRPTTEGLAPFEALLFDWLFPGEVEEVDLAEREAVLRRSPELWRVLWEGFCAEVEAQGEADGLIERQADSAAVTGILFAAVLVLVVGVAGIATFNNFWIACVVAGALVLVTSTAYARRSAAGALLDHRWRALGRYLHEEARAGADLEWEEFLPYAVPLGMGHEVARMVARRRANSAPEGGRRPAGAASILAVADHVAGWRAGYLAAMSTKRDTAPADPGSLGGPSSRRTRDAQAPARGPRPPVHPARPDR